MTEPSLAELVALISHRPDGAARDAANLDHGLAGALLADLVLAGRITRTGGLVAVRDAAPTGEPLCDTALHHLLREPGREPRAWVVRLTGDLRAAVLDRLVRTGRLRHEPRRVWKVVTVDRFPTPDGHESPAVTRARHRVRAAVLGPEAADPRTAALSGLIEALGWGRWFLPDVAPRQLDGGLAALRRAVWPATVVRELTDERRAGPWGPTGARIMANLDERPR